MTLTLNELDNFHRFAAGKLNNGAGELSLEECLRQWREAREEEELIADVQRSLEDIEAGRVHTLDEAVAEIRQELIFSARDRSA